MSTAAWRLGTIQARRHVVRYMWLESDGMGSFPIGEREASPVWLASAHHTWGAPARAARGRARSVRDAARGERLSSCPVFLVGLYAARKPPAAMALLP